MNWIEIFHEIMKSVIQIELVRRVVIHDLILWFFILTLER